MRFAALLLAAGFAPLLVAGGAGTAQAGYYCSPGFEATSGGRCVATLSRDEVDLYLNEPAAEPFVPAVRPRHHRRRHGIAERY